MRTLVGARLRQFAFFSGVFVLVCALSPVSSFAFSGTGLGTEARPYKVATCDDLQDINNDLDAYYVQTGNIDCSDTVNWNSGAGFTPIGHSTPFSGTYDGQNFVISDIYEYTESSTIKGLFASTSGATIKNIRLSGGSITSSSGSHSASLVAFAAAGTVIQDCTSDVTVHTLRGGGLIGMMRTGSSIARCSYTGDLVTNYGVSSQYGYGASVIGDMTGSSTATDVYGTGTFHFKGPYNGSLVGYIGDGATITNAYTSTSVTSDDARSYIGGLIGSGSVTGSLSTVEDAFYAGIFDDGGSSVSGTVIGLPDDINLNNIYYYANSCPDCNGDIGSANGSGTRDLNSVADINDFKNSSTNEPMVNWDFDTVWQTNAGDFPTLRQGTTPADSDGDGISNAVEDAGANSGDANGDGVPDSSQANVVVGTNAVTSDSVSLTTDSECEIASFATETEAEQSANDSSYSYPLGLINFTLTCNSNGATATVTQYLADTDQDVSLLVARKITNNSYTTISDASIARQTIGDDSVIAVTYNITDGGTLDADGSPNGTIVDPVGVALSESELAETGQNQQLMASATLLALLLVSGAIYKGIATLKNEY